MIELFYWPTPNGHKITLFLEESGLEYKITPINISKGEQFQPEFLKISPNNRIPAIVDHAPKDGGAPISIFESGAILTYLADKTGRFLPVAARDRSKVLEWLFWQVGGLGPMAGQNGHFENYAPEKVPYALERYRNETHRLYGVLNKQLKGKDYICGDYSIADMASYPWVAIAEGLRQDLTEFSDLTKWIKRIGSRPATQRAYDRGKEFKSLPPTNEEARKHLFGKRD